jgi:hypothetical protein
MSAAQMPKTAPYAPPGNILNLFRWCRNNSIPDVIDAAVVETAGTSAGNSSRTLVAIKFMELVDADGRVNDTFRRLCESSGESYPEVLASIIRNAYQDIFAVVDPSQGDLEAINAAFQDYEPGGQRDRMAALFVALCREAGIIQGGTYRQRPLIVNRRQLSQRKKGKQSEVFKPEVEVPQAGTDETSPNQRLIAAVVERLPKGSTWTHAQRDRWLQLVTAAIDNLWEVEDDVNLTA